MGQKFNWIHELDEAENTKDDKDSQQDFETIENMKLENMDQNGL